MIPEIDTSSVVDETESAKVTTESQMEECSTELMRRPETTDGRWIPAGMQGCPAGVTLMNVGCECKSFVDRRLINIQFAHNRPGSLRASAEVFSVPDFEGIVLGTRRALESHQLGGQTLNTHC